MGINSRRQINAKAQNNTIKTSLEKSALNTTRDT
jgi:hypothetical protein